MAHPEPRFVWPESSPTPATVTFILDGEPIEVPAGVSVASAMLGHDDVPFCRSTADGEKRAPHCLMGVCFECLVTIDGVENLQACLEPVREGMRVDRAGREGEGSDAS